MTQVEGIGCAKALRWEHAGCQEITCKRVVKSRELSVSEEQ